MQRVGGGLLLTRVALPVTMTMNHRCKQRRGYLMSPDEVIQAAAQYGVQVAGSTLRWYRQKGLIPAPKIRSLGRGRGVSSEYPPETPAELIASKLLLRQEFLGRRVTAEELAEARAQAYGAVSLEPPPKESGHEAWRRGMLMQEWLERRARVLQGVPLRELDDIPRTLVEEVETNDCTESQRPLVERVRLVPVEEAIKGLLD